MFASVEDLLDSGLTDALIVATPASTHRAITEAALGADQHVLVEKPMALTAADAETMAAQASEAERVLMVAHTFLFNPAVRHISKLIETGRLGEILHIHSQRTGLGPVRSDVSVLWDLAPHDLALFHAWVPAEPVEISASGQAFLQSGVDDVAVLTLRFANGIFAAIHASWIDPVKTRRTTVVGRRAMAVFDDTQTVDKLRIYDNAATYQPDGPGFGEFAASVRAGDVHIPRLEPREPLKDQVAHFVECVQQGATPLSDSRQGLYVAKILEAAESQLAGNRA